MRNLPGGISRSQRLSSLSARFNFQEGATVNLTEMEQLIFNLPTKRYSSACTHLCIELGEVYFLLFVFS